jgi:hypothetical protein
MASNNPLPRFAMLVLCMALVQAAWLVAAAKTQPPTYALLVGDKLGVVRSYCYLLESTP